VPSRDGSARKATQYAAGAGQAQMARSLWQCYPHSPAMADLSHPKAPGALQQDVDRSSGPPVDRLHEQAPERPSIQHNLAELQAGINREHNFQRIFERYYAVVLSFFTNRGFPQEECKDLTQEAFFRIYKGIDSYRRDGPFEGWLFQVAANVYRNTLRDRSAGKRHAQEDSLESFLEEIMLIPDQRNLRGKPVFSGPLEGYLEKERLQVLARALQELPEQMRRCVVLRFHQELKYREIADIMRISIETVKAHLYQARRRLREQLADYFEKFDAEDG